MEENPIEIFELSDIWDVFITFFEQTIVWLFTHGIEVYGYVVTFGEVLVTVTILYTVFWVFLPWFNSDNPGEGWEDDDYYD